MTLDEFLAEITARNAKELARLQGENSILKKIVASGYPLTVDFADRKHYDPSQETKPA